MEISADRVGVEVGARADLRHCPSKGALPVAHVKQDPPLLGPDDIWVDGQGLFVHDTGAVGVERVGVQVSRSEVSRTS